MTETTCPVCDGPIRLAYDGEFVLEGLTAKTLTFTMRLVAVDILDGCEHADEVRAQRAEG